MAKPHTDPWDRALTRIMQTEGGCWEWTSYVGPNGYAAVWTHGRKVYVHRLSYERHHGEIPEGRYIDHLCRNKRCSNPEHLEAMTPKENVVRGLRGAMVTVCRNGHTYTAASTAIKPNGTRRCRVCSRKQARERYARRTSTP